MKFNHILLLGTTLLSLALGTPASAQNKINDKGEMIGEPWTGSKGVTESISELMAKETMPENSLIEIIKIEREADWPKVANPNSPKVGSWPSNPRAFGRGGGSPYLPQSVGRNWEGVAGSESAYQPPDSNGGVSPTQVLICVNGRIKLYDKNGVLGALNMTTNTFFGSVLNGSTMSDPQVRYDPISQRWFVIAINVNYANNRTVLAVSNSGTLTNQSSFTFYFFEQQLVTPAGNSGCLGDYPSLGVDANALYIGENMFTQSSYQGASVFVVRKSSVLSGGSIVVSAFRNVTGGTSAGPYAPRGCDNWDAAATEGYFIGVDVNSFGKLQMRRVSNPGGTPTLSANLPITVPSTANPLSPPQSGGSPNLAAIDDRIFAAKVFKNSLTGAVSLWCAHNIQVNSSGVASSSGGRNGSRWYQIGSLTSTPALIQSGTLFDPAASGPKSYWMPSVAMTGQGHMALGSSVSSTSIFAGNAFAGQLRTDGAGTTQAPTNGVAGVSHYTGSRWGDYSETTVDPGDNMTCWSFQCFAGAGGRWSVQVTELKAPPPATPSSASPSSLNQNQANVNVVITGTASAGSEFYSPPASFPNHISASVSGSGVTVNSVTFTDPTHVTLNLTVSAGASAGARNITVTNPDGQTATGNGILTINGGSNPIPTLTSISPNSRQAGLGAFTLNLTGTNFVNSSIVRWDGSDRTTTFNSSTSLSAAINASDVAVSGTHTVTVFNPAPGGGTSGSQTFTVTAGAPVVVNPASFSIIEGSLFSGGLAQLFTSDNGYVAAFPDSASLICTYEVNATAPATGSAPILTFNYEGKASRPGLTVEVLLKNYSTNLYDSVDSREAALTDDTINPSINGAANYISGAHAISARISFYPFNDESPTQDGWLQYVDLAHWQIQP